MKNPTLLKENVDRDQAVEVMDFLYSWYITRCSLQEECILWYHEDELIAKWTKEYRNIMISKDFVDEVSKRRATEPL